MPQIHAYVMPSNYKIDDWMSFPAIFLAHDLILNKTE